MRVSSPSLAAAFIDGATSQGADVVDYGLAGTDMLYFAVAAGGLDGGAQITASHNPKQYNGMKMVREEAFPLSGDAGISRHPRHDHRRARSRRRPPRAAPSTTADDARRLRRPRDGLHRPVGHQAVQRRARRRQRHRRPGGAEAVRAAALPDDELCFTIDGTFPNHEANPLIEENRRDIVEEVIAAEGRHRHRLGRRRRPLLLHRRQRRVHRRATSSPRCSPRRS